MQTAQAFPPKREIGFTLGDELPCEGSESLVVSQKGSMHRTLGNTGFRKASAGCGGSEEKGGGENMVDASGAVSIEKVHSSTRTSLNAREP